MIAAPVDRPIARQASWCRALLLLGAAVWASAFTGTFIYDDHALVTSGPAADGLMAALTAGWGTRPLLLLTFALSHTLGGGHPWAYHVVNVAIHVAAALVLFGLLRRVLGDRQRGSWRPCGLGEGDAPGHPNGPPRPPPHPQYHATWLAFAAAALWLVHPVHTQAVTYIVQRGESLASLLYLLVLYALLRGAWATGRARAWYLLAIAACWSGLLVKQIVVTAPLVALLFDRACVAASWREVARRWPVYLGLFASWVLVVADPAVQGVTDPLTSAGFTMPGLTPYRYLITQGGVILYYLGLLAWPGELLLDHDWGMAFGWAAYGPSLVVGALFVAGLALWWAGRRGIAFLVLAFFLVLAPTSSVFPIAHLLVEHRIYLASAAVVTLVVLAVGVLLRRQPRLAPVLLVLFAAATTALGVRTVLRNLDYRDPLIVWGQCLARYPDNPMALSNLGARLLHVGQVDEAILVLEDAASRRRSLPNAANTLGLAYARQGRWGEAAAAFRRTLRRQPEHPTADHNLGIALARLGQLDEARAVLSQALPRQRDRQRRAVANRELGDVLARLGHPESALTHLRAAVELSPRDAKAWFRLALLLDAADRLDEAIVAYRASAAADPRRAPVLNNLGIALARTGDVPAAVAAFERAVAVDPAFQDARANLERARALLRTDP